LKIGRSRAEGRRGEAMAWSKIKIKQTRETNLCRTKEQSGNVGEWRVH